MQSYLLIIKHLPSLSSAIICCKPQRWVNVLSPNAGDTVRRIIRNSDSSLPEKINPVKQITKLKAMLYIKNNFVVLSNNIFILKIKRHKYKYKSINLLQHLDQCQESEYLAVKNCSIRKQIFYHQQL